MYSVVFIIIFFITRGFGIWDNHSCYIPEDNINILEREAFNSKFIGDNIRPTVARALMDMVNASNRANEDKKVYIVFEGKEYNNKTVKNIIESEYEYNIEAIYNKDGYIEIMYIERTTVDNKIKEDYLNRIKEDGFLIKEEYEKQQEKIEKKETVKKISKIILIFLGMIVFIIFLIKILNIKLRLIDIIIFIIINVILLFLLIPPATVLVPAAKPIIYIYPEEQVELTVKLGKPENITCSYPKYENGWKVIANPDGTLVDTKTGRSLYALYWEGIYNTQNNITEGFVVKGEDTISFLEEKLEILGLNEREAEEFIVYWLPKLEANKYNYIRFASMEEINEAMPLEFSSKPDTLIRVLMQFKGLDKYIEVPEQKLETPIREGFVVVEWGGTELK